MTKRILISNDPYEARAVLMEGDRLVNIEVESAATEKRKGHIYRGRVTAIEPSIEAAFVDYGGRGGGGASHGTPGGRSGAKDGFLPFDEVSTRSLIELTGRGRAHNRSGLRVGDIVLVQVSKEEVGRKGATLTMFVSLPGRYVVLMPFSERTGISRKLDGEERDRLRSIMNRIRIPDGFGVIMRTSGEMTESPEEVQADLDHLVRTWEEIVRRFREGTEPSEIHAEASLAVRFVRDYLDPDVSEILVEDAATFQELSRYLHAWMPHRHGIVRKYEGEIPLFMRFGVERQIEALMNRRVPLPSGGSIVIGETEALTAIDVNSGRLKHRDAEETALATNLEAAREIARQVILRDLGGIIVVDFIDMDDESHRHRVEEVLRASMTRDKARLTFGRIGDFGLLAFSRQRIRQTMDCGVAIPCQTCQGTGRLRSPSSLAMTALRRVRERLATLKQKAAYVEVVVPVAVANFLNNRKREDLTALEKKYGVLVDVTGDPASAPHDIRVNVLTEVPSDRTLLRSFEEARSSVAEQEQERKEQTIEEARSSASGERSVLKGLLKIVFGLKDESPLSGATPFDNRTGLETVAATTAAEERASKTKSATPPMARVSGDTPQRRQEESLSREGRSRGRGAKTVEPVTEGPILSEDASNASPSDGHVDPETDSRDRTRSGRRRRRSRGSKERVEQSGSVSLSETEDVGVLPDVVEPPATSLQTVSREGIPTKSRRRRGGRRRRRPSHPLQPSVEPSATDGGGEPEVPGPESDKQTP